MRYIKAKLGLICSALLTSSAFVSLSSHADSESPFSINGNFRARFEHLDGQFRNGYSGSDRLLLLRSLVHSKYTTDDYTFGLELHDNRAYLSDDQTPLSNGFVNATDILQAYVKFNDVPSLLGDGQSQLVLGRQTITIGSRRMIQRINYAPVIRNFTGAYSLSKNANNDELHLLYVVPLDRRPSDRESVEDNKPKLDKEQWNRRFWGAHYRKNNALGSFLPNTWAEAFLYGFDETDFQDSSTLNRHTLSYGSRLYKKHKAQQWDYDLETIFTSGTRHQTANDNDTDDLDVDANLTVLRIGYTFDHKWNPNLAFQYLYASGDDSSTDNKFGRHEMLFGARRPDLNHTSMHGPLAHSNLSAPGFRFTLRPDAKWDAYIHYGYDRLATETGLFRIGKYRDETGQSGDFMGHNVDSRFRFWTPQKEWLYELGLSLFFPGEYVKNVRYEERETKRTTFVYAQVEFTF